MTKFAIGLFGKGSKSVISFIFTSKFLMLILTYHHDHSYGRFVPIPTLRMDNSGMIKECLSTTEMAAMC